VAALTGDIRSHGTTAGLLARDRAHLVHPQHDRTAVDTGHVWVKGDGVMLTDADGRRYIDGLAGLWNVTAGHGRTDLADAARDQMAALGFASGYAGSSNPRAIELAERLAGVASQSINRFFFTSGGAEANETAIKIARSYWKRRGQPGKTKVVSLQLGYHGVTLAAMSATGIGSYWPSFEPRVPGFIHVASPYPYRYQGPAGVSQGFAAANELEQAIVREGPETVAFFLAEPVQGVGGVIVPQDDYFPRIRAICDRYDVLFGADEVITGFGRTGRMFALEHWGVEPDMVQFAKAITSGYFPFGGVGISDRIADVLDAGPTPWMHAFTYSAHPVGCAVALRMLDVIETERFSEQAAGKGRHLLDGLRRALEDHPHVGEVRGKGLMCAVEFVADRSTRVQFPAEQRVASRVHAEARLRGLFSRVSGDTYLLAPPIVITTAELDRTVAILSESVRAVLG
jgi:adenosylmethionine-8-amino-7-oxononanoate aminotransferase